MSFSSALDKLKESFLVAAAQGGSSQDCESLLEMGANINWKGQEGDTPILAACRRGRFIYYNSLILIYLIGIIIV